MSGKSATNVVAFPEGKISMRDTETKLYERLTISLNRDEKIFLEALSFVESLGTSTIARRLFLRGLEAFIKDRGLSTVLSEEQMRAKLNRLADADADLASAKGIILKRQTNGKRAKYGS